MLKHGSAADKAAAAAEFHKSQEGGGVVSTAVDATQLVWGALSKATGGKNFAADNLAKGQKDREISGDSEIKALVAALERNTKAQGSNGAAPTAPNAANRGATIVQRSNQ